MAAKLTIVPKWKGDLSKKEIFIKIGAFIQKLSWNKEIDFTKIPEKIKLIKKLENPKLKCTYSSVLESSYEIW